MGFLDSLFGGVSGSPYKVTDTERGAGRAGAGWIKKRFGPNGELTPGEYTLEDVRGDYGQSLGGMYDAQGSLSKPYLFDYGQLPSELGQKQYEAAVPRITKTLEDQLMQGRNSLGSRRPDLLFRLEEEGNQNLSETLGGLQKDIGVASMLQESNLMADQQKSQEAADRARALGLSDVSGKTAGLESDILNQNRGYFDDLMFKLLDYYNREQTGRRGSGFQQKGIIGDIAQAGSSIAF